MKQSRRHFLITSIGGAIGYNALANAQASSRLLPTPAEVEGPFYPVTAQKDSDFDLTIIEGHTQAAEGEVIRIQGVVVDTNNLPIEDASVEIWQANAAGRYRHPHDTNPVPLDSHFQGWAIVASGLKGNFRFRTILPGAYPVSAGWTRPPHIHYKVSKRGFDELVTQMYFNGHPLNAQDRLLQRKLPEERQQMIATRSTNDADGVTVWDFRIVLQGVQVF